MRGAASDHSNVGAWLPLFFAAMMSIVVVEMVAAQNAPPSQVLSSFSADRSELTVGDVVILSLVVSHPTDLVVVVPRLEREWGPFEVQGQTSVQTISVKEGIRTIAKQFRVTLFATGTFETPGLQITIRSPDGSVQQMVPAPVQLTVTSVLSGSDDQLKGLRPPADLSISLWDRPAALIVAGLSLLCVIVVTGYYLYRRSRRPESLTEPSTDTRNPWEVAMQKFERITQLDLPRNGDMKEHYTLVAEALRDCLAVTFRAGDSDVGAADMSTEEIGMAIRQSSIDPESGRMIIELLQEADLVKFANYAAIPSRAYEAAGQARALAEAMRLSLQERNPVADSARGIWAT